MHKLRVSYAKVLRELNAGYSSLPVKRDPRQEGTQTIAGGTSKG